MMNARAVGGRYLETMNLDVADVAKLLRADFKAAVAAGRLPRAKYSVRIERYAGGQSIHVEIKDAPVVIVNRARIEAEMGRRAAHDDEAGAWITEAAHQLKTKVEEMVAAYNYDRSDPQTDYFDCRFYGSVRFCGEQERRQREAIRAQVAALPAA